MSKNIVSNVWTICHPVATDMMYAGCIKQGDMSPPDLSTYLMVGQDVYYFDRDPKKAKIWSEAKEAFDFAAKIGTHVSKYHRPNGVKIELKHGHVMDGVFVEKPCKRKHFWDSTENDGKGSTMLDAGIVETAVFDDILDKLFEDLTKPRLSIPKIDESKLSEHDKDLVARSVLIHNDETTSAVVEYLGKGIAAQIDAIKKDPKLSPGGKADAAGNFILYLEGSLNAAMNLIDEDLDSKPQRQMDPKERPMFDGDYTRLLAGAALLENLANGLPKAIRKARGM